MAADDERRKHQRIDHDARLFVKIISYSDGDVPPGTTFYCAMDNISRSGLRINTKEPLSVGCLLDLWIGRTDKRGSTVLSGTVKWSNTEADGSNWAGIEILVGTKDKMSDWSAMIDSLVGPKDEGTV